MSKFNSQAKRMKIIAELDLPSFVIKIMTIRKSYDKLKVFVFFLLTLVFNFF